MLIDTSLISVDTLLFTKILTAFIGVTFVSIVHLFNVKFVSKFQIFFTGLKITLIFLLVFFGFLLATGQPVSFLPAVGDLNTIFSAPFAISLVFVMYAYSGWNASIYIANDIKNPDKNLPLSLILGTAIVIFLYVPINAVFMYSAPIAEMQGQEDVGYIAANHIFGGTGGLIMGVLISIGLISAISSMVWAGPRVTQVMGEDVKILKFLSIKNKNQVPYISLILQYIVVIALILTSSFEAVIKYIGFLLSLSSFLTVLGVIILRFRQPNLERPYKTWGYPVTPFIYMLVTGWMMYFIIKNEPAITTVGFATIIAGLVLYFINKMVDKQKK
ncbi:amino acid permease [Dolichospermum sp. ST_sed5]|nr:amino acid permease [Dolichospermum sp. ST_sed5]